MSRKSHKRRKHHVRRHRNPSMRGVAGVALSQVKSAAVGALGALGLDVLYGYGKQWLPDGIASNKYGSLAVKAVGAVGLGLVANRFAPGRGTQAAIGALTVMLHGLGKELAQQQFPNLPLSEYLTYAPQAGEIVGTLNGMGDANGGVDFSYDRSFQTDSGLGEYMT